MAAAEFTISIVDTRRGYDIKVVHKNGNFIVGSVQGYSRKKDPQEVMENFIRAVRGNRVRLAWKEEPKLVVPEPDETDAEVPSVPEESGDA